MSVKVGILSAVALLLLVILARSVDLHKVFLQLTHFPLTALVTLCALSLSMSLVKASRFLLLFRKNGVDITYLQIVKVYFAGQATTPLPGGEAFRALILKKEYGIDVKETSSAVIMQALILFISSAVIGIIGSIMLGILMNIAFITLLGLLGVLYLLLDKRAIGFLLSKMKTSKHKHIRKHTTSLKSIHKSMQNNVFHEGSKRLPGWTFMNTLTLGIVANVIGGFMIFIIANNYHTPLNLLISIYVYAMSVIIGVVSGFVPGGIGFTEGGMTGLLLLLHVAVQTAIPIVLIYRFIDLIFYVLVGVICTFLFYTKTVFGRKENT